ncbi:fasciclin domain-containing protein [Agromyces salentinus]|uniref:Fasciclin domain-containing protein n=1 Tax=Agromyces salentinus TaxID=269421 RepID=A0ABN2N1P7_9MICO|nr:fasciclin domain-containing protein [Agromyces salentinus]
MKKILAIAAAAAAIVMVSATPANATGDQSPAGTVVDVAVAASGGGVPDQNPYDYDLLVQALTATGLVPVLADTSRRFTVFAPNDRAFLRLVTDLTGEAPTSEQDALEKITTVLSIDQISNVLLYHVVADRKLGPIRVLTAGSLTMANGGIVKPRGLNLRDENTALKDPRLVIKGLNIQGSNGVIHTIDRVLVPAVL